MTQTSLHNSKRGTHGRWEYEPVSRRQLARECGEVVYFIRCHDGLIKIGYTNGHLDERWAKRKVDWTDLLAIVPGTRDTECSYHVRFDAHLADGRERFYPHQEILDVVNEIRGSMGPSLLASF